VKKLVILFNDALPLWQRNLHKTVEEQLAHPEGIAGKTLIKGINSFCCTSLKKEFAYHLFKTFHTNNLEYKK
jgi:hypothetical protein